jgi:hypothetical protein
MVTRVAPNCKTTKLAQRKEEKLEGCVGERRNGNRRVVCVSSPLAILISSYHVALEWLQELCSTVDGALNTWTAMSIEFSPSVSKGAD